MQKTNRNYWLDNCKFFLIILVVFGHVLELTHNTLLLQLLRLIYIFHMPAFVFIAGFTSQLQQKVKLGELFLQYVFFQTLYMLFSKYILQKQSVLTFSIPYWLLWFLLALIVWKAITPYIVKNKLIFTLAIACSVLIGFDAKIGYYFTLSRIIVFFPFFLAGYWIHEKQLFKILARVPIWSAAAILLLSFLALFILEIPTGKLLYFANSYTGLKLTPIYGALWRFLLLVWSVFLSLSFFRLVPKTQKIFSHLGQRTLQVFLLHGFIIKYVSHIHLKQYFTTQSSKYIFFLFVSSICFLLFLKPFSYIFLPIRKLTYYIAHSFPFKADTNK